MNYYNEFDAGAAAWLRELISNGLIPNGDVDERSIVEVQPSDLDGYTQCHFFAGIGGWSEALRFAGWSANIPVWTGSCPCQPFSVAGKQKGEEDERHLWPEFRRLIEACKPPVVFGEQVASKAGRVWLSGVFADLEKLAYRRAGADLCAAGVGAPHIRQRLFWVADTEKGRWGKVDTLAGRRTERVEAEGGKRLEHSSSPSGLADTIQPGLEGYPGDGDDRGEPRWFDTIEARPVGESCGAGGLGNWGGLETIHCAGGTERRLESGVTPLAHGFPERVGLLRGFGNAIVPQIAAEFITAYVETLK